MLHLILMTGPDCSLCIQAEERIHDALAGKDYQLTHCDVTTSFDLKKRYGLRIPVLVAGVSGNASELGWPFNVTEVHAFYSKLLNQ